MANVKPIKIWFPLCFYTGFLVFGYLFLMLCAVIKRLFPYSQAASDGMIEMNLPVIGKTDVPHHYFSLFACAFSLGMSTQILKWVKKFEQNMVIDFPVLATFCLFISLSLLLFSCWSSEFWLMFIAFLWVTCITIDASCRYSSEVSLCWERKDIYSFIGSLAVCVIVIAVMSLFIHSQLKDASWLDYIVIFPILLLVIPRWLIGSTTVRSTADYASSVWYQVYGVFVFITSLAHIGFKWFLRVINKVDNKGMAEWFTQKNTNGIEQIVLSNKCKLDILSFFALLSVVGLISYFLVFPQPPKQIGDINARPHNTPER